MQFYIFDNRIHSSSVFNISTLRVDSFSFKNYVHENLTHFHAHKPKRHLWTVDNLACERFCKYRQLVVSERHDYRPDSGQQRPTKSRGEFCQSSRVTQLNAGKQASSNSLVGNNGNQRVVIKGRNRVHNQEDAVCSDQPKDFWPKCERHVSTVISPNLYSGKNRGPHQDVFGYPPTHGKMRKTQFES